MLVLGAMPLFYMEVILGQFNRQGPISLWKICPIFKGVGYCAVFIAYYVSFYYNVIIGTWIVIQWSIYGNISILHFPLVGWSFFYLGNSFSLELPWNSCDNEWNTKYCAKTCDNSTSLNSSIPCGLIRSPAKEYFK